MQSCCKNLHRSTFTNQFVNAATWCSSLTPNYYKRSGQHCNRPWPPSPRASHCTYNNGHHSKKWASCHRDARDIKRTTTVSSEEVVKSIKMRRWHQKLCDSYLKCHYGEEKHSLLERNRDRLCWAPIALFFPNRRTAFDSRFIVMCKIDSLTFSSHCVC